MRLLIATEGDVGGQVYAPVAREMMRRGHEVHIYSRYLHNISCVSEYLRYGIEVRPLETLWGKEKNYDYALVYREVQNALKYHKVPTGYILFGPHSSEQRVVGAQFFMVDIMFVGSENNKKSLQRSGYNGEIVVTGLPKYDELFNMPKRDEKLIVVPDSPNSPQGCKRKRYFQILAELANRLPDHQVLIKPRTTLIESFSSIDYLLGNDKHMEFYLRETEAAPSNLRVLEEPASMNELASRAALMISVPGSAVFGQMLLKKPALIIHDAVSPDQLMHNAMYRCNIDIYLQSGCGIWMEELLDYVPKGLIASQNWVENEIGLFDGQASARVADVLEATVRTLGNKVRWFPILNCPTDEISDRLIDFKKVFDTLEESKQELCHQKMLRRKIDCGLSTIRNMAKDLIEGQELEMEIEAYGKLANRLFALNLPIALLEEALYPLMISLGELADRIWGFHKNIGFFKNEIRMEAENLITRIGLRLADTGKEMSRSWADVNRENMGYNMLDYLLEDSQERSIALCRNIATFLANTHCSDLAAVYAIRCLEAGDFSLPHQAMDYAVIYLKKHGRASDASHYRQQWEAVKKDGNRC